MRLIPAIDLRGGRCVRLLHGDFDRETLYSEDPVAVAEQFSRLDVDDLHVVDLDGALTGRQENLAVIRRIADATTLDVQVGGGIRAADDVRRWLDGGAARCVVGSTAVRDPDSVCRWFDEFGADRFVLAFDVHVGPGDPEVAIEGWTEKSGRSLWDCIDRYRAAGLVHLLCTDIGRDGALSGPNIDLYRDVLERYPELQLQASGGVRDAADLRSLADAGIPAAISGRALLDGRISLDEVASFRQSA